MTARSAGRALPITITGAAIGTATFAGLAEVVHAGRAATRLDARVLSFVLAHRTGWLNVTMEVVTWLGSSAVLTPLLVAATVLVLRARNRFAAAELWIAFGGAVVLSQGFKFLIDRARPPQPEMITSPSGPAYPSGHTTQVIVSWGILAIVLAAGRPRRARVLAWAIAVPVIVLVGASRVYLGVHWLTDVLGGYALGGSWLAVIAAVHLRRHTASDDERSDERSLAPRRPVERSGRRTGTRCSRVASGQPMEQVLATSPEV